MALSYKTQVPFNETPNGSLKVFTTAESFYALDATHGSLTVIQGATVKTDFSYTADKTITFGTAPSAPATAGTLMIACGLFGESGGLIGLWSPPLHQLVYGLSTIDLSVIISMLYRADARVQQHITDAAYDDAVLSTPVDPLAAEIIRTAIGDLAVYYMRQQGTVALPAESYSENYSGVVSYSQSSGTSGKEISQSMTEASILGRLAKYAVDTDFLESACVSWGTGRIEPTLIVTDDDEDDD